MFNKVILMGRICHDLELKTTPTGVSVLSFRIAVDRSYQTKGEERKSDFFDIVTWRSTAEFVSRYFSKGKMILVEGELQTRQYVDKAGQNRTVTEIVADSVHFTGEKKDASQGSSYQGYTPAPSPMSAETAPPVMAQGSAQDFVESTDDDDYPF